MCPVACLGHYKPGLYVQSSQRFCAASNSEAELCEAVLCAASLQWPGEYLLRFLNV